MDSADGRDLQCKECKRYFTSFDDLKTHILQIHSFNCQTCERTFYSLLTLTQHQCGGEPSKGRKTSSRRNETNLGEAGDVDSTDCQSNQAGEKSGRMSPLPILPRPSDLRERGLTKPIQRKLNGNCPSKSTVKRSTVAALQRKLHNKYNKFHKGDRWADHDGNEESRRKSGIKNEVSDSDSVVILENSKSSFKQDVILLDDSDNDGTEDRTLLKKTGSESGRNVKEPSCSQHLPVTSSRMSNKSGKHGANPRKVNPYIRKDLRKLRKHDIKPRSPHSSGSEYCYDEVLCIYPNETDRSEMAQSCFSPVDDMNSVPLTSTPDLPLNHERTRGDHLLKPREMPRTSLNTPYGYIVYPRIIGRSTESHDSKTTSLSPSFIPGKSPRAGMKSSVMGRPMIKQCHQDHRQVLKRTSQQTESLLESVSMPKAQEGESHGCEYQEEQVRRSQTKYDIWSSTYHDHNYSSRLPPSHGSYVDDYPVVDTDLNDVYNEGENIQSCDPPRPYHPDRRDLLPSYIGGAQTSNELMEDFVTTNPLQRKRHRCCYHECHEDYEKRFRGLTLDVTRNDNPGRIGLGSKRSCSQLSDSDCYGRSLSLDAGVARSNQCLFKGRQSCGSSCKSGPATPYTEMGSTISCQQGRPNCHAKFSPQKWRTRYDDHLKDGCCCPVPGSWEMQQLEDSASYISPSTSRSMTEVSHTHQLSSLYENREEVALQDTIKKEKIEDTGVNLKTFQDLLKSDF